MVFDTKDGVHPAELIAYARNEHAGLSSRAFLHAVPSDTTHEADHDGKLLALSREVG